ncbi:MAG TPA: glutamate mutase L [Candidatus Avanaerovorax faecigallinarum]|nr:glutamate mutase L [Candidatus Avanaerovorax faecigallinarum]
MKAVLLIDFGSTYTKITAVDIEKEEILGTAQSFTTIETDINDGLKNALKILEEKTGPLEFSEKYACSSAAGGLRMVAIGLVPELTAQAAKQASLGAGAKVVKTYSYELTDGDVEEIDGINPDILLLTGGTDGGNKDNIIHNAHQLAKLKSRSFPIIIAGNRSCTDRVAEILEDFETFKCENVMPKLNIPNVEPVQELIRSIFLKKIVLAKGLSQAEELIKGILMPTPAAMLEAMKLLAKGTETEEGIGDLVGVDLGGATTDVYSMSYGLPQTGAAVLKGLREDYAKRTVEGDIGMRYSIKGIVAASDIMRISDLSGLSERKCEEMIDYLSVHTDKVPGDDEPDFIALDYALASMAVEAAVTRHAGKLEPFYTPTGISYMQTGKDLTGVKTVVATGGALIHTKRTGDILKHTLSKPEDAFSLKPKEAEFLVDRKYILAAMGLLSTEYPDAALRIMKKELEKNGVS